MEPSIYSFLEENPSAVSISRRRDGTVMFVNDKFCAMVRVGRDDCLGRRAGLMFDQRQRTFVVEALKANGSVNATEIELTRADGTAFWAQLTIRPCVIDSEEVNVAWIYDITARKTEEEVTWRHANFDSLTGLPNRRLLLERLDQHVKHARRTDAVFSLIFMDLDGFKAVNDTHGHAVGDDMLVEVARRLSHSLRDCDTLSRIGGDEFVAILPGTSNQEHIFAVGRKVLRALDEPLLIGAVVIQARCSIGASFFPQDSDDPETLLHKADLAMYKVKRDGKHNIATYEPRHPDSDPAAPFHGDEIRYLHTPRRHVVLQHWYRIEWAAPSRLAGQTEAGTWIISGPLLETRDADAPRDADATYVLEGVPSHVMPFDAVPVFLKLVLAGEIALE